MTGGYKLIARAAAQPGMVLSDVLLDAQGQVLLPQGAVLTEATLAALGRHGIEMLPIAVAAGDGDPGQARARLDHLFRNNDRNDDADWATTVLRGFVEHYRLGQETAQ